MASLIDSYEQQYSVLTADITAQIGTLKSSRTDDRRRLISGIESHFDEANDLLEQLEIEVRGSGQSQHLSRLACYTAELARIKKEFQSAKQSTAQGSAANNTDYQDAEEYYDEWRSREQEQKAQLLDSHERMERTGKQLTEGYRLLLEAEQAGTSTLGELSVQRETITRARNRLRETDEHLSRSSRIMNSMMMRSMQQKFIVLAFLGLFIIIITIGVYLAVK